VNGRLSEVAALTGAASRDPTRSSPAFRSIRARSSRASCFVALRGERFDGHAFVAGAAGRGAAAPSSGKASDAALPQVVVHDAQAALTALAAAWRATSRALVLGVGGSNGKTTTKELLAAISSGAGPTLATRGNLNNHIGVPLTLLRLEPAHRYAVVEMGANHPGEIAALAAVAKPAIAGDECRRRASRGLRRPRGVAHAEEGEMFLRWPPTARPSSMRTTRSAKSGRR
jgi:UDP-N-acetylmuramoyl-tripeptide--D-alanyl-D-alanine ligase